MTIKKKSEGSTLTVFIAGRVDTSTAPEAQEFINQNLDGMTALIIDFKEVNYISSAGLRMLLTLQKKMMQLDGMKLVNVSSSVNDVFEVTGFDEILDFELV